MEHSLHLCARRIWLPGESPESPPTASWGSSFPKLHSSDIHQYAEETSFLLKACFYSHSGGEGGEGEMELGIILAKKCFEYFRLKCLISTILFLLPYFTARWRMCFLWSHASEKD